MNRNMLPLLEFTMDEIYVDCYNCKSWVSPDQSFSNLYRVGQEKIEELLNSKEHELMKSDVFTKEDKQKIKQNLI